jgi:hypothetical protein
MQSASDARADEFDGGKVVFGALVVTSGDAPEVLDAVEEALDKVPLPVEPAGERKALLALAAFRDSFSALAVNDSHPAKPAPATFLDSANDGDTPIIQLVPDGFKAVDTEHGPDFRCADCDVAVQL